MLLPRFKEKTITLDSVIKMSGGKVGIVMVLLENKRKKVLTRSFLSQRISREVHLHKRGSTGHVNGWGGKSTDIKEDGGSFCP